MKEKIIKNQTKCKHKWEVFTPAQYSSIGAKDFPAKFKCRECDLKLHASDAIQLGILRNEVGFKNTLSAVALIISLVSLVVAVFV